MPALSNMRSVSPMNGAVNKCDFTQKSVAARPATNFRLGGSLTQRFRPAMMATSGNTVAFKEASADTTMPARNFVDSTVKEKLSKQMKQGGAPVCVETAKRTYTLSSQFNKGASAGIPNAVETVNIERAKMPDGTLKFAVNGRDFTNTVAANEKVRIVSESATFTITPRTPFFVDKENAEESVQSMTENHMDHYFNLMEESDRWFNVLEEQGNL